jgi:hypothetical protein
VRAAVSRDIRGGVAEGVPAVEGDCAAQSMEGRRERGDLRRRVDVEFWRLVEDELELELEDVDACASKEESEAMSESGENGMVGWMGGVTHMCMLYIIN